MGASERRSALSPVGGEARSAPQVFIPGWSGYQEASPADYQGEVLE